MGKKLKGRALSKFEARRDVWQEVLDGVRRSTAQDRCLTVLLIRMHLAIRHPATAENDDSIYAR
jgi:hypothetical protein